MARPTALNDLTERRILDAIAKGLPRDTAARRAGISPAALYSWLARGRKGESPFVEFLERVQQAEAKDEEELLGLMRLHAAKSYQAAQWLLSIRRPDLYGRAPTDDTQVSDDEAEQLIAEAARLAKAG